MLFFTKAYGQSERVSNLPEKLTLIYGNEVKIVIESAEILKIPQNSEQDNIIRNLLSDIYILQDSLSKLNTPLTISYYTIDKNGRRLKVSSNSDTKAEFIIRGNSDTIISNFFNYKIEYRMDKNNLLILYTNKFSNLASIRNTPFSELVQQVKSDISSRNIPSYKAKFCQYFVKNDKIDIYSADVRKKGTFGLYQRLDFGLSYVNDRFLSNISCSIAYVFSPKNISTSMIGLTGNLYLNMDPNRTYNMQGSCFVDAFYNKKMPNHPFFYATDLKFFAGYLVHREGDVFGKDFWRIGLDMPAGKNFRIKYVTYFNIQSQKNSSLFEVGINYMFF